MPLLEIIALAVLFVFSAGFSASETALTALSTLKIRQLIVLHPEMAHSFHDWLDRPHRLLVTILVGNNTVNIALSSLIGFIFLPHQRLLPSGMMSLLVWLGTTLALLVFGEIVPKIVARSYAEHIGRKVLPLLHGLSRAGRYFLTPVIFILKPFFGNQPPVNRLSVISLEDMRHVIEESRSTGHMPGESGEMMSRVLAMHQRRAVDIMRPASQVDSLSCEIIVKKNENTDFLVDRLSELGWSRVPLTRKGFPIGTIHVSDILSRRSASQMPSPLDLVRPVHWVSPETSVVELLEDFKTSGQHIAMIQDEQGIFLGLVTLEDVLEEVVGEIVDEYDLAENPA